MAGPCIGSIGELLVEFVCTEKDARHRRAAPYTGPFPSGAPGIFIDQAARLAAGLGGRAVFAGAVGDDAFGSVILRRLVGDGVDPALIRVVRGVPTGTAHVGYNSDGSRDFVFNMARSAAACLPAAAEADRLFPAEAFEDWSARLLAGGARAVVLKRGDQGCIGRDAAGALALPAHAVTLVDPTGAGDCFCATFVTLTAAGQPMALAMARANAAGALAVGRLGPMEGNSTLAEIDAQWAAP